MLLEYTGTKTFLVKLIDHKFLVRGEFKRVLSHQMFWQHYLSELIKLRVTERGGATFLKPHPFI